MRLRLFLRLGLAPMVLVSVLEAQAPKRPPTQGGAPAVSPDGSKIAFLSDRDGPIDLYVIGADGAGETRLSEKLEGVGRPDWSSDGKHIRFAAFANDASRLYAIDPDGKNQTLLGTVPGRAAALSPDGSRVIYWHWTGTWTAVQLFVSNLDGSARKQLTDGSGVAWNTRWSPDGKRIAFTTRDSKDVLNVSVMGADGSGLRQVTHFPEADGQAQVPAWSPDGKLLAVQAGGRSLPGHIFVVDVATGEARKLNAHTEPTLDEVPSWFPDQKRIAFQSNRSGTMEIWVMNADGSSPRQVTR